MIWEIMKNKPANEENIFHSLQKKSELAPVFYNKLCFSLYTAKTFIFSLVLTRTLS